MKLTRSSLLPAAGVALVIALFAWAWIATDRHHSSPTHMGFAVEQMQDAMQNGSMPMGDLRVDEMDMTSMHAAMHGGDDAMPAMTPAHMRQMHSMGMGLNDNVIPGHGQHHRQGR